MVRCDEFYCKYQRLRDLAPEELKAFCDKNPETIRRIDLLLDDLIPLIKKAAAKSEILNLENTPIGGIVSEGALRPLMSEHDPEIRDKIADKIIERAENKTIDGQNPRVTNREVAQIVAEVKGEPRGEVKAVETAKEITAPQVIDPEIPATPLIQLAEEPRPDPVEAIQQWQEDLAARGGIMGLPSRSIFTDLLELKSIQDMTSYLQCPRCGRPGVLVWQCCGSTIDEALERAQELADAKMGCRGVTI